MKKRLTFRGYVRTAKQRDISKAVRAVSLLITALAVLLSYIYATSIDTKQRNDHATAKVSYLRSTTAYIQNRFVSFRQILLAGATATNIKGIKSITREDWRLYYDTNYIRTAFPGILALGLVEQIPPDQVGAYTQSIRESGFPGFTIQPETPRNTYTAITYIEPFDEVNQRAFGYDMFTEPLRQTAMKHARDTGSFGLSAPVVLKQDEAPSSVNPAKSVLLYYPIYTNGGKPATATAREAAISGYVYIAFRVSDMLSVRETELSALGIGYRILDVTDSRQPLEIVRSGATEAAKSDTISDTIALSSRRWKVILTVPKDIIGQRVDPVGLFLTGLGASVLLGGITYFILTSRVKGIRRRHESELQQTKDELLALASHQLRTPASGVKQYIGMLRHGYFGSLTDEQIAIAEKAYRANERQLEIIDQLLYVAKADANQLIVQPEAFNIAHLVRNIQDEVQTTASAKNITLQVKAPKELTVLADERFVAMIIENLFSNAIKYSYENSVVRVTLSEADDGVRLAIKDKGVGIAPEDQDKLFQKFSRIPNDLSTKEGGSGLGLYLARRLAQAHGGEITVHSSGKGTTFTLSLPHYTKTEHNVIQLTA